MAENIHTGNGATRPSSGLKTRSSSDGTHSASQQPMSLRDAFDILYFYRRRSAAFFVFTMALVVVGLVLCPRKYSSETRLLVRVGKESISLDPTATTGEKVDMNLSRETEIRTALQLLNSRTVFQTVVETIGPPEVIESPVKLQKAVNDLRRDVEIWCPGKSNIIAVTCELDSPELAMQTLQLMIDTFLQNYIKAHTTSGSYEFFASQSEILGEQLEQAGTTLEQTKSEFGLASIEGRRESLEKHVSDVEARLLENQAALSASESKIEWLREALSGLPDLVVYQFIEGLPNNASSEMRQQLYRLQTTEQEFLSRYTEAHPLVVSIRAQVREAERILEEEQPDRTQAIEAVLLKERATVQSLQAEEKTLREQDSGLHVELEELNSQERCIADLQRQFVLLDQQYRSYCGKREQARIDRALQSDRITNINIVQPPTYMPKPTSPHKVICLAIGLFVSFFGAIGLAFVSHHLRPTVETAMPEHLGVPVVSGAPPSNPTTSHAASSSEVAP